jgi:hypothetical protein
LDDLKKTFDEEKLIYTDPIGWATKSEVFQRRDAEDPEDILVINPIIQHLTMWGKLGVEEKPSLENTLKWLSKFDTEEKLDGPTAKRVKAMLARYPSPIWTRSKHWISLDGKWTHVEDMKHRVTMASLIKTSKLFPSVETYTADMKMLTRDVYEKPPFSNITDLGSVIVYKPHKLANNLEPNNKPPAWLGNLAHGLRRVKFDEESKTKVVKEAAQRLCETEWQPIKDLSIEPYLNSVPIGEPEPTPIFWFDKTLFVRMPVKISKMYVATVEELARPFNEPKIKDAIAACIDRSKDFIMDYLEDNFQLTADDFVPVEKPSVPEEGEADEEDIFEPAEELVPADEELDDKDVFPEGDRRGPRGKHEPTIFEKYARSKGYEWTRIEMKFVHENGCYFAKAERPFYWTHFTEDGMPGESYWPSEKCLKTGGVDVPADVWALLTKLPEQYVLLSAKTDGSPVVLSGKQLNSLKEKGIIRITAATYRLWEETK